MVRTMGISGQYRINQFQQLMETEFGFLDPYRTYVVKMRIYSPKNPDVSAFYQRTSHIHLIKKQITQIFDNLPDNSLIAQCDITIRGKEK